MEEIDDLFDVFQENNNNQDQNKRKISQSNQEEDEQLQSAQKKQKLDKNINTSQPPRKDLVPKYEKQQELQLKASKEDDNNEENKIINEEQELQEIKELCLPSEKDYKGQEIKKNQPGRDHKVENIVIESRKDRYNNCVHEEYFPQGIERNTVKCSKGKAPAKTYPFQLDHFQKRAVDCIELNESVLVAAHTSAGKTAVAEYAIALTKRENQKVIYTSPIKALSNQKFRELSEEFGDVGLVTGDVSQNQSAQCLVMTTEILRSMLYKGSEITREVKWVIFDEVHYMRDKERGVVWEETMILLNPNVRYVFLSATIPNAGEFAEWICKIKKQPCHVVYTDYRPTPLQHYLYPSGGDGVFLIIDDKGRFREENFNKAVAVLSDNVDMGGNTDRKKRKKPTEGAELHKIAKMIMEKGYDPVIIFSFSKKEVEGYAMAMNKMDLTTVDEKEKIEDVFTRAMSQLAEEDQKLPQIEHMLPVLKRGIGIHHGGLLPIVKEVIEILFQAGWIKILFSTETFSMGVNMPAKTVVFTSVRKFDGTNFRWINGGEYIQMSGRAGRRGLDATGITILMVDEKMDQQVAKTMLKGSADALQSSFHLNYNMLMNSMRMEDFDPEFIIRRSLLQFQNDKQVPKMKEKYQQLQEKKDQMKIQNESSIEEIYRLQQQIKKIDESMKRIIITPKNVCPFLSIGRLLRISHKGKDWGWGVSVNFTQKRVGKKNKKKIQETGTDDIVIVVDVMLHIKPRQKNEEPEPHKISELNGQMEIIPIDLECVQQISAVKLNLPNNLVAKESKDSVKKTLMEIEKRFGLESVPQIDPIKEMKIQNEELDNLVDKKKKLQKSRDSLEQEVLKSQNIQKDQFQNLLTQYEEKQKVSQSLKLLETTIEDSEKMILSDDLKCMKRVMRRLEFLDKDDIVQMKGKVACEISASDEILATELLFLGIFNDMEPAHIAAVLSCLLHDENSANEKMQIKDQQLNVYYNQIVEQAKRIFQVLKESKITIEENEYVGQIKPQLMDVVLAWCKNATFLEICKMCDVFEGSIIRCMRRLDELLKQMSVASKVIGNEMLELKFLEASKLLKRGIIFAASLYL